MCMICFSSCFGAAIIVIASITCFVDGGLVSVYSPHYRSTLVQNCNTQHVNKIYKLIPADRYESPLTV